jgi:hypothetical protein
MVLNAGAVGGCEWRHGLEEELKGSEDCKVGKENTKGVNTTQTISTFNLAFGFATIFLKYKDYLFTFATSLTLSNTPKLELGL